MKLDEVTLQNILKAYGKEVKPSKAKPKIEKDEIPTPITEKLATEDLNIINYNKDGKTAINSKKKDALIDFFQ